MTGALAPLSCPRCHRAADASDLTAYRGCPDCAADRVPVNYVCQLPADRLAAALRAGPDGGPGLWRWAGALPVAVDHAVSLGEGDTPLVPLRRLGERWGLPRLYAKNESANPTWSHKDRLAALTVAAASAVGATTVTAASTGNHGAALAAYAASAGLRCVIFTLASVPQTMKTLMLSYGAEVIAVAESEQRYSLMAEGVTRYGWFPASNGTAPPVGSSPYGVDGYKTIAYELVHQLGGTAPDVLVLPVAYGDCLAGIHRGFTDLHDAGLIARRPRLVGAEVFPALSRALGGDTEDGRWLGPVPTRPTAGFSIGGAYTTRQAVRAIRESAGRAVIIDEAGMLAAQLQLASTEGIFAEASSAAAVAAVASLARTGEIGGTDLVVVLLTSTALKDPAAGQELLPAVPVVDPTTSPAEAILAQLQEREPGR